MYVRNTYHLYYDNSHLSPVLGDWPIVRIALSSLLNVGVVIVTDNDCRFLFSTRRRDVLRDERLWPRADSAQETRNGQNAKLHEKEAAGVKKVKKTKHPTATRGTFVI